MTDLVRAQAERFAALDPRLPPFDDPPEGEELSAALPDGREVGGVLYRAYHGPGTPESLWAARENWELTPVLGNTGAAGMAALLGALRRRLDHTATGADSACVVAWPSRDADVTRVLLDHGLVPLNALAVRPNRPPEAEAPNGVLVRRARPVDEEEVVALRLAELEYSALVGSNVLRQDAVDVVTADVRRGLVFGGRSWLAEMDGVAVGLASCGWSTPAPGSAIAGRLTEGRWGYVGTLSVRRDARGGGVGRALMAVAHRELNLDDVPGTFLFYSPVNPLSSVFWHRQGYRPLWTFWEVRPAGALR
ncbi:Acetyltransferase (GNAT) family protein [Amycolatopsis arida]|uniref:Acetyltransferase (GNAT) family protein n=1 Tax=Amycolatopsis arida TaxID=587909 RepID=A0A1I6AF73_9PSEU|nr:GNAT family N-acetyltransferase [Amycolatopsis arida]TDX97689.1 acetyltransferase (GNAT) family protein [Amycolatopsis arida]SFQ67358.1 Acetyltransferase (GNAT) family protein [Amycolatopsis arida]